MNILAIESSCDETAAAVIRDRFEILSNVINTQIDTHKEYGGVVPEIASRMHIENISTVVDAAIIKAGIQKSDIDAVAVTYGPGLVGALLVGVCKSVCVCLEQAAHPRASHKRTHLGELSRNARFKAALYLSCCLGWSQPYSKGWRIFGLQGSCAHA